MDHFRKIEKVFNNFKFYVGLSEPFPEDNWTLKDNLNEVNLDTPKEVNLNEVNMKGGGIIPRDPIINEENIDNFHDLTLILGRDYINLKSYNILTDTFKNAVAFSFQITSLMPMNYYLVETLSLYLRFCRCPSM